MAKKSRLQIWAEYSAASLVLGFLGVLPRSVARLVSIGVARLGYRVLGGLRKSGMRSLAIAYPEIREDERKRLLRGTFESLGRVLGEVSQFSRYSKEQIHALVDFTLDEYTQSLYDRVKNESAAS